MVGRVQKSGRSVSVLSIDIADGDERPLGFAHATFMAAPNPSLRMPTIVRDEGLLRPHPPTPRGAVRRAGGLRSPRRRAWRRSRSGPTASTPRAPSTAGSSRSSSRRRRCRRNPAPRLSSLSMRYAQPVRVGPAVGAADVRDGLGNVVVRDAGRDDRLAVIATTRTFD